MKVVYHYTTMGALAGILPLNPQVDKEISLWATRFDCLNDTTERKLGITVLKEALQRFDKRNKRNIFNTKFDNIESLINLICNPFIISFTKNRDDLSMWNVYSDNGKGIALTFDLDTMQLSNHLECKECLYYMKRHNNLIDCYLEHYDQYFQNNFFEGYKKIISEMCVAIKDRAFKNEREWRLYTFLKSEITSEVFDLKTQMGILESTDIKYRFRNGMKVYYSELLFSHNLLKEIWLGPAFEKEKKEKLYSLLTERNFQNIKINNSAERKKEQSVANQL